MKWPKPLLLVELYQTRYTVTVYDNVTAHAGTDLPLALPVAGVNVVRVIKTEGTFGRVSPIQRLERGLPVRFGCWAIDTSVHHGFVLINATALFVDHFMQSVREP